MHWLVFSARSELNFKYCIRQTNFNRRASVFLVSVSFRPKLHNGHHLNTTLYQTDTRTKLSGYRGEQRCFHVSLKVKQYACTRLRRLRTAAGIAAEMPFRFRTAMRPPDLLERPWVNCRLVELLPENQLHATYCRSVLVSTDQSTPLYPIPEGTGTQNHAAQPLIDNTVLATRASEFHSWLSNGTNGSNNENQLRLQRDSEHSRRRTYYTVQCRKNTA